jgi:hypothetical protein
LREAISKEKRCFTSDVSSLVGMKSKLPACCCISSATARDDDVVGPEAERVVFLVERRREDDDVNLERTRRVWCSSPHLPLARSARRLHGKSRN